jgi:hypothetical protein
MSFSVYYLFANVQPEAMAVKLNLSDVDRGQVPYWSGIDELVP